jgi:hypothetical protein
MLFLINNISLGQIVTYTVNLHPWWARFIENGMLDKSMLDKVKIIHMRSQNISNNSMPIYSRLDKEMEKLTEIPCTMNKITQNRIRGNIFLKGNHGTRHTRYSTFPSRNAELSTRTTTISVSRLYDTRRTRNFLEGKKYFDN